MLQGKNNKHQLDISIIKKLNDVKEENNQSITSFITSKHSEKYDFTEAIKLIKPDVPEIEVYVKKPFDFLKSNDHMKDKHQDTIIQLFTSFTVNGETEFQLYINNLMRDKQRRQKYHNWVPYLELLIDAFNNLPSRAIEVYRISNSDLSSLYPQNSSFTWWGFSTCIDRNYLSDLFDSSKIHIYTIFKIESQNVKDMRNFSNNTYPEYIILPGTQFVVQRVERLSNKIVIHLRDVKRVNLFRSQSPDTPAVSDSTTVASRQSHPKQEESKIAKAAFDIMFDNRNRIRTPDDVKDLIGHPENTCGENILDKIRGSIVGMALGDALGAHVEFRPHEYLLAKPVKDFEGGGTWNLNKGQFTDDTSMALCLGASLVLCQDFNPYDQLVRYKWWYRYGYMSSTGKCFDIGVATRNSIVNFEKRQHEFANRNKVEFNNIDHLKNPDLLRQFDCYCSERGVAGNGALMRLAPVPLFFREHPKYAVEFSGISGVITHGDKKAEDACRYYGALIVAALNGTDKLGLLSPSFWQDHEELFNGRPLVKEVMVIAKGSFMKRGGYAEGIRGKGYIINALEAALWAFWSTKNFEEGALAAVNLGDDTDTTAAIYGQLAGIYYGYKNLPKKWLNQIYAHEYLVKLSDWIAYEGTMWKPNKSLFVNAIHNKSNIRDIHETGADHGLRVSVNSNNHASFMETRTHPHSDATDNYYTDTSRHHLTDRATGGTLYTHNFRSPTEPSHGSGNYMQTFNLQMQTPYSRQTDANQQFRRAND